MSRVRGCLMFSEGLLRTSPGQGLSDGRGWLVPPWAGRAPCPPGRPSPQILPGLPLWALILTTTLSLVAPQPLVCSVAIPPLLSLWGWPCLWCPHLHSPGFLSCLSVGVSGSDSLCSLGLPRPPPPTSPPGGPEELLGGGGHPLRLQARLVHGVRCQPVSPWLPLSLPPVHRLWGPAPPHPGTLFQQRRPLWGLPAWLLRTWQQSTLGSCPEPCVAVCGWRHMFWVQVLLAGLVAPLLLGATLTYTYRRCQPCKAMVPGEAGVEALTPLQATQLSPPNSTHTPLVAAGSSEKVCTVQLVGSSWSPGSLQTQELPSPEVTWPWDQLPSRALGPPSPPSPAPPAGSAASTLQPGPQLYDVMDAVPARRWKEFVRTLGLREAEIEAVEVEVGRFRDQQYEMLKRWRQQQPAGLAAVYAALERMGLDGCAEDLRSRLQRGP
ncbi:tumor necrosis factor receptor superfamily member 25 isoform X8 [Sus scrofa]|uniref:tumor necrosis factor receptor superfamily member 25 isoform X8 n=1 Tax=Sus scrofa TaxID=9823 RepID=UPI000A2B510B|nr:tumor necrosis factor receptor superfamily member 25 isoform X8 [Sus scrofa]